MFPFRSLRGYTWRAALEKKSVIFCRINYKPIHLSDTAAASARLVPQQLVGSSLHNDLTYLPQQLVGSSLHNDLTYLPQQLVGSSLHSDLTSPSSWEQGDPHISNNANSPIVQAVDVQHFAAQSGRFTREYKLKHICAVIGTRALSLSLIQLDFCLVRSCFHVVW